MKEVDDLAMKVATFRFGVIADFATGARLGYGDKERLLAEKASRSYEIPGTTKTRISRSAMLAWINAYKKGGYRIEALCPKPRSDKGSYRSLDTTIRMAIKALKEENPNYTVPVMIKKLRRDGIIATEECVNTATIYRFLKQEKLEKVSADAIDRRRFEAEHSNEIWQCDVLHGPMVIIDDKGGLKKAYLMAILDDHSRLIIHARFYLSESFEILKQALRSAIARRGIPQKFYVDNGACYRSEQLERILASLGIALSHSRPYKPQGRGKVERWFKNVRSSFLPMLPAKPISLDRLNEMLAAYVDDYNGSWHSSIKQTPNERYRHDLSCIRPAPERLMDYFRRREYRRVKKDRTVQIQRRAYEVSAKLVDKTVELLFHDETPGEIEIAHQGLSYGRAVPLDLHVNAKIGRDYADPLPPRGQNPQPSEKKVDAPIEGGRLFDGLVYQGLEGERL